MITIIAAGLGTLDTLTIGGLRAIESAGRVVLQTGHVPLAAALAERGIAFDTLDSVYDAAADFDDFNTKAAEALAAAGSAVFCALGSIWSSAIAAALRELGCETQVLPGVSPAGAALDAAGVSAEAAQAFTASSFAGARFLPGVPVVVTEVDSAYKAADVALRLMEVYPHDLMVWVVRASGAQQAELRTLARLEGWDYASAIVAAPPAFIAQSGYGFYDLCQLLAMLRSDEGGCPWDREQTHASLKPYLLEEAYEVMDAVDREDPAALADELGDVLMQAVFHAQIGAEHGEFTIDDVTTAICTKMIRRHVHIFGKEHADTAKDVADTWERVKRKEKGMRSFAESLRDVPRAMSQLIRAAKIQKKAASIGFDWPDASGAMEKAAEELEELRQAVATGEGVEEEAGDLLFSAVNVLRLLKLSPDTALDGACNKFIARIERMEAAAAASGQRLESLSLEQLNRLWDAAKRG